MEEKNFYFELIKKNLLKCDKIITVLDGKGRDTKSAKVLISDLEQDFKDLQGKQRSRYSLETVVDCYEMSEFYLKSLRKRGRIL